MFSAENLSPTMGVWEEIQPRKERTRALGSCAGADMPQRGTDQATETKEATSVFFCKGYTSFQGLLLTGEEITLQGVRGEGSPTVWSLPGGTRAREEPQGFYGRSHRGSAARDSW